MEYRVTGPGEQALDSLKFTDSFGSTMQKTQGTLKVTLQQSCSSQVFKSLSAQMYKSNLEEKIKIAF